MGNHRQSARPTGAAAATIDQSVGRQARIGEPWRGLHCGSAVHPCTSNRPESILLDCGLFQGLKLHREHNWLPLPFAQVDVDAVVLGHAHVDHRGYLQVLVKRSWPT